MPTTRDEIFLIGFWKHQLTGVKLPSKGDCLKVLFYNLRIAKLSLECSARLVIKECFIFWEKAKIPTKEIHRAIKKLIDLYNYWRYLMKNKKRNTDLEQEKREKWKDELNDLFDVAHGDALNLIKLEEDKQFLISQRSKGREGCMTGVDSNLKQKEERIQKRAEEEELRKKNHQEAPSTSAGISNSDFLTMYLSDTDEEDENSEQKNKRARKDILTPRLAAVFDKLKLSSRDVVHILIAVLESVKIDPSEFVINRTSIRQQRDNLRKCTSQNIVQRFSNNGKPLTIHWDTKLLTNITGRTEDRLAIVATAPDLEHILNMPDIPSGTGLEISSAVYDTLEDNNILEKIEAFVFDTTASNTGKFKGACTMLEKRIGRDILHLGCRHHIFEIVLAAVFAEANIGVSTGPDIVLFKKFKKQWPLINQNEFEPGINNVRIKEILGDDIDELLIFAQKKIKEEFPRSDYKELLELIIIFLGGIPPRGLKFTKPGAYHLARWMSKAMYCFKILLFQNQFSELKDFEKNGLLELAGFIIKCYFVSWFDAEKAHFAPLNDLTFLRKLEDYKTIHKNIADKAISKIINHLYYLSEECVAFALFDERISCEVKLKLISKMNISSEEHLEDEEENVPKKLLLRQENFQNFIEKNQFEILEQLFTQNTTKLFKRFNITTNFLETDPSTWENSEEYRAGKHVVQNLKIVNDCAERGIKLIQDYHEKVTKDEEQRQYLFKVVQSYRQKYTKDAKLQDLYATFDP